MPTFGNIARLTVIVLSSLAWGDLAAAQPGPRRPPAPKIDKVCWIDRWDAPQCIDIEQLRRVLSESEVNRLLAILDRLSDKAGARGAQDTLVECGGTARPVAATVSSETAPRKSKPLTPGDLQSLVGRISACAGHLDSYTGSFAPAAGSGGWVDNAVAQANLDFANCRDSGSSPVAQGEPPDAGPGPDSPPPKKTDPKVVGVIDLTPKPPATAPTDSRDLEGSLLWGQTSGGTGTSGGSGGTGSGGGSGGTGSGGATGASGSGDSSGTPSPPPKSDAKKDGGFWQAIVDFFTPTPATNEPAPSPGKKGTTTACRDGADCAPTCEEKQARWERFKQSCERSNWQEYRCIDFLRKANGCVDASRINPGPDGDMTCPVRSGDRSKLAWELNCKRKQMFVVPVPGGGEICKRADAPMPAIGFNVCTDPHAMPVEGQCTAGNLGGPDRPPAPAPDPRVPGRPLPSPG